MKKDIHLMIYSYLSLVLNNLTGMVCTSGTNWQVEFTKVTPLYCGPRLLGSAWVDRSRFACADNCLTRYSNCNGFMYNPSTRLCTPSSGLSGWRPPPTSEEGELFIRESCQSYPDFNIYSNGSVSSNAAYYYYPQSNYSGAWAVCQCLGSHLYVADSIAKYWLTYSIINTNHWVYIGLDDIAEEGRFVWADSGQEINGTLKKAIFAVGQPDNWHDEEDCAIINPDATQLNDGPCSGVSAYICEKSVLCQDNNINY